MPRSCGCATSSGPADRPLAHVGNRQPARRASAARALAEVARADDAPQRGDRAYLAAQAPDVVLLASLTFSRSLQIEQLKAAQVLAFPVAACIMSWDHLSSKTLLHIQPDPDDRVERRPEAGSRGDARTARRARRRHRRAVLRPVVRAPSAEPRGGGGPPSAPARSSAAPSASIRTVRSCSGSLRDEPDARPGRSRCSCKQWIETIRASANPRLRDAGVLVRPHPERREMGRRQPRWPRQRRRSRAQPDRQRRQADYFDSLYYSDAVVGLVHERVSRGRDRRPSGAHASRCRPIACTRRGWRTSAT